jgi:hypothetical protein
LKWKVAAIFSSSVLLLAIAAGIFYFNGSLRSGVLRSRLTAPAVVTQVQRLNELATVKYTIQRVVGLNEQKQPFGEESILLMVQGQAMAGVDLSGLNAGDLSFKRPGEVEVRLPPAKLVNVYLDEKQTKVWDRHITWWTPWVAYDPELETKARLAALDDVRSAALKMGILDEAHRNAEAAIQNFFRALHIQVTFSGSSAT